MDGENSSPLRIGDRVVDAEALLAARPNAEERPLARPFDNKKSAKRRKRRGRYTIVSVLLVVSLAGLGIWTLARSLSTSSSHGFGAVTNGQTKTFAYAELGPPCVQGNLTGSDAQHMFPGATYALWQSSTTWQTVVFSAQDLVIAKFQANRDTPTNYCSIGLDQNPYEGPPWFLVS